MKNPLLFPLKTGPLGDRGGIGLPYTTSGMHRQNKHDRHTDSRLRLLKTNHQEMEEDHKTKEARDEGVEKHSCQIELRGAHLKVVYYNGKQIFRAYSLVHFT